MIKLAIDNTKALSGKAKGFRGREPEEITKALIERLAKEPGSAKDTYIQDTEIPGFKLRKAKHNGSITFAFVGRMRGAGDNRLINRTLGIARGKGAITLSAARTKAARMRDKLGEGIDPLQEQRARNLQQREQTEAERQKRKLEDKLSIWTVAHALEDFIAWRQARPEGKLKAKTVSYYRESIGYLPSLANVPVEKLTVEAVRRAIDLVPTIAKRANLSAQYEHTMIITKGLPIVVTQP